MKKLLKLFCIIVFPAALAFTGCAGMAASAEEYYSIGMAYFEIAQGSSDAKRLEYFREAEKWLYRARQADRTMLASQYNLGRLAFELERYEEAAEYFEDFLKRDPVNILALRAAAYTRIKTGDFDLAEKHYIKLLELVPDSIDDGYNHALVLYAMEQYGRAEEVLEKYPYTLADNKDLLLLYARSQKMQDKAEALNSYSQWLDANTDVKIRYEYIQLLEQYGHYARVIEEYNVLLQEEFPANSDLEKSAIRFSLAKVLLIADSESGEGITELETAITEGFNDIEALEELMGNKSISNTNWASLRLILENMKKAESEAKTEDANTEQDEEGGSEDNAQADA